MTTEQQSLQQILARAKLPQVILFYGPNREQGRDLLTWLLQRIFCAKVCGACAACRQVVAGKHNDVLWFTANATKFGVEAAGKLQEFMQVRSYAAARVAIIIDAHLMTKQAANKLLKMLEEPHGYVFLYSDQKAAILPTVLSRCFHFYVAATTEFTTPYSQEVREIFTATSLNKALKQIKDLKQDGCKVSEFLPAFEMHLHAEYMNRTVKPSPQVRERRRHLHALKRLAKQQVPLNIQLCAESILGDSR
ncbi:MAG: hypothetical protein OYH77_06075 [Pseudomonadota bacterium]|nr:hypothetical protein [Pseudomonadota bacterium]